MVSDRVSRRTFVGSVTAAGAVGLAGCGGFGGDGDDGNGDDGTSAENGTGGTDGTDVDEDTPTDEETETPVDEADLQVRAVHASPDADPVDVSTTDAEGPLVTDLGYGELPDYGAVEAGIRTIEVRPAGEDEVLTEVDADFQEGRAHTAFAMGYAEGEDDTSEEALQVVAALDGTADEASAGQSSSGTGNETATGNETETTSA